MQHAGRWKSVLLEHVLTRKISASTYLVLCICHSCSHCQEHYYGSCTPKAFDGHIVSPFLLSNALLIARLSYYVARYLKAQNRLRTQNINKTN